MNRYLIAALALLMLLPGLCLAHESRPLFVIINEQQAQPGQPHLYQVKQRTPPSLSADNRPRLLFPDHCKQTRLGSIELVQCSQPLPGQLLRIEYPHYNPSISSLIRFSTLSGQQHKKLLGPDQLQWQLPASESTGQIIQEYTWLGVTHILAGWDHLLFVLCLLVIAGTLKRTLITITGFTLAHSLTLVLITLDIIRLPVAPVEAVIALSILLLTAEIARGHRNSLTWRYPVTVSTLFGLVHGCGFAAVLSDIGLPQTERPTALLFFNIGVELGQLLFVALVMTVLALFKRWRVAPAPIAGTLMVYGMGTIAAYWTLERISGF